MRRRKGRRKGLAAVLLVCGLLCVSTATAEAGRGTQTDAKGTTIKIGTYAPVADNASGITYPQIPAAVKAAVRAINRDGGFRGAKAEVVFCDTKDDPNGSAACARKFVDEGVVAVVGGYTIQGPSLVPVLQDAGIPNIGMVAINAEDNLSPISFPLDGTLLVFPTQALQLGQAGAKNVYVARADVPAAAVVPSFIKAAAKEAGITVAGVGSTPLNTPDLTPYASAAQASGADTVELVYPDTDAVKFIRAAQQIGYKPKFSYQEGGFTPEELKQLGSLTEGMVTPGPFPPVSAAKQFPELGHYLRDIRAQFKTGDQGAAPKYYGSSSIRPWLAVQALRKVIEASPAGPITSATVLNGLRTAQNLDLGLIPPWTPSKSPIPIFPRMSNTYQYFIKLKHGKYVLVDKQPVDVAQKINFVAALSG